MQNCRPIRPTIAKLHLSICLYMYVCDCLFMGRLHTLRILRSRGLPQQQLQKVARATNRLRVLQDSGDDYLNPGPDLTVTTRLAYRAHFESNRCPYTELLTNRDFILFLLL